MTPQEKRLHILIVDDSPTGRKLLKEQLECEGMITFEATNGLEGLDILNQEKIDLIFSDVLMPLMDGNVFCTQVRRDPQLKSKPFVIYSATHVTPADQKRSFELGADRYLEKPAELNILLQVIRELTASEKYRQLKSPAEGNVKKDRERS